MVVYASDQSYFTGEHGYAEKRLMYEEALKMPLVIRWPGVTQPGTEVEALVQNIDYGPTFLDMAGIPVPASMQGKSLTNILKGDTPADWRQSVYYHYYDHGRHVVGRHEGIRTHTHKLIHFYTDDVWELYDLEADPYEVNNVYGQPGYEAITDSLKMELDKLQVQYEVPGMSLVPPCSMSNLKLVWKGIGPSMCQR